MKFSALESLLSKNGSVGTDEVLGFLNNIAIQTAKNITNYIDNNNANSILGGHIAFALISATVEELNSLIDAWDDSLMQGLKPLPNNPDNLN